MMKFLCILFFAMFVPDCASARAELKEPGMPLPDAPPMPAPPVIVATPTGISTALATMINEARKTRGLEPLAIDDQLTCVASIHAAYLREVPNLCQHLKNLDDRMEFCGGERAAGEVIACRYHNFDEVVGAWLNSPSHAKILLSNKIKRIGGTSIDDQWVVTVGY